MAVTRCSHIGLLYAIVRVTLLVVHQLVAFVHRLRSLLIVAAANQIQIRDIANLDTLVIVGKGNLKTIDTIVELGARKSIRLSVVPKQHLRVLLKHKDVAREARVVVLHLWHCVLVLLNDLLKLLVRSHVIFADLVAGLDVLEEGLISLAVTTAWALKDKKLHDLSDVIVKLHRRLPASTILPSALPASLRLDATFAVEAIALRALHRVGRGHELAQSANEQVERVFHPRRFVNLARTWLGHFWFTALPVATDFFYA